jgi:hypothetical protein
LKGRLETSGGQKKIRNPMRGSLGFPISASRLDFSKRIPHRFCQADAAPLQSTYSTIAAEDVKVL